MKSFLIRYNTNPASKLLQNLDIFPSETWGDNYSDACKVKFIGSELNLLLKVTKVSLLTCRVNCGVSALCCLDFCPLKSIG